MKVIQQVFNILFYICTCFAALFIIFSVILFFLNVDAKDLMFPPFATKMTDGVYAGRYSIWLDPGHHLWVYPNDISLDFIKTVIYSHILVWIYGLLTAGPIFKLLSVNFKNRKIPGFDSWKNDRLIIYAALILIIGTYATLFIWQLYYYYVERYIDIHFIGMDPANAFKFVFGPWMFILMMFILIGIIPLLSSLITSYKSKNIEQNNK
ncbi:MAG: hypothetical protein FWD71_06975 [Oscillospiraceae bacterium]|nr:hypothetical protein [Oscillospiraceae bacterium]